MNPTIIIDDRIPFIHGVFEPYAKVIYLPAQQITSTAVKNADALIVRTRTQCNAALLSGSKIQIIVTATIGFDHIDTDYCARHQIVWRNAPGCNATSVAQYITTSLLLYSAYKSNPLHRQTLGIVGVGHVGSAVAAQARMLGLRLLLCDPFKAETQQGFLSLQEIAQQSDIITFHTPLTHIGKYPTYHLADASFFAQCLHKPLIINSARGGVIDEKALLDSYQKGFVGDMIIDCWENEPNISLPLMQHCYIATPHIAGYSADGKMNATRMAVAAIDQFFNLGIDFTAISLPPIFNEKGLSFIEEMANSYNPLEDSRRLKNEPTRFEQQRSHYPLRREP